MTIEEAKTKIENFYEILSPSDEQISEHVDNLRFLATKKDLFAVREYGNAMTFYGRYDIAEKCYNLVIETDPNGNRELSNSTFAHVELGDLYLNNFIGNKNYGKAYEHYLISASRGNDLAKERIAEMYRVGIFVEKNYNKYVEIITEEFAKCKSEGRVEIDLYLKMAQIKYLRKDYKGCEDIVKIFELGSGFGAINIFSVANDIKNLIEIHKLQYRLGLINENQFDIFSIEALTKKFKKFSFKYRNKKYELKCCKCNAGNCYEFNGERFTTLTEFILKAKIHNETILEIAGKLTNYRAY